MTTALTWDILYSGGAVSAAAVGLSIATGGMGLGLATLAVEAVAGGRTALRGGNSADVATSMANAGAAAAVAGSLMPVLPATVKVGLGAAGVAGSGIKLSNDLKTAKETFSNPSSTAADKLTSALDVAIDGAALIGSAALIGQNLKPAANELGQVYNGAKQVADSIITSPKTPTVESTQSEKFAVGCGEGGSGTKPDYYVTPDGVAFKNGIPDNYVENPYRSGSYGIFDENGKFYEKLRIDPATPAGKKGPSYSHYHIDGGKEHFSPRPSDNNPLGF